jgi:predicted phosphoribosyltransferase
MKFENRVDAGNQLTEKLRNYKNSNSIVLALPRGGVPVAYPIAKKLNLLLDLVVVRKLGLPHREEVAMGAIAPEGIVVKDEVLINSLGISDEQFQQVYEKEKKELKRRMRKYREGLGDLELEGKDVIVVDDGLATGRTMRAAIKYISSKNPAKITIAVPVCPSDLVNKFNKLVDELLCLYAQTFFTAVGNWYKEFGQTTDEEVLELLHDINR